MRYRRESEDSEIQHPDSTQRHLPVRVWPIPVRDVLRVGLQDVKQTGKQAVLCGLPYREESKQM